MTKTPAYAFLILMALSLTVPIQARAETLDNEIRVALQSELRRYLSAKTEQGVFPFLDPKTQVIQRLRLKRTHPVIFRKDGEYLMCADFTDAEGQPVLIDLILVPFGNGYRVVREIEGRRPVLTKIFEKLM